MSPNKQIKILNWNANGILARKHELHDLLEADGYDVALINETHLRNHHKLRLANFTIYRTDRPGDIARGGTAVIVRSTLVHEEIPLPTLARLEATGVTLRSSTGPVRVFAAYSAPNTPLVPGDIEALLDSPHATILAGDFNAKHSAWNSKSGNAKGKLLLKHSIAADFTVSGPAMATRVPTVRAHRSAVLDIAISKNLRQSLEMETLVALSSDHNPVKITLGDELDTNRPEPRHIWRRADWEKFGSELDDAIDTGPIDSTDALDRAVVQLTDSFHHAISVSVPVSRQKRTSLFDLPISIKIAIADKNKSRRCWQRCRTNDLKEVWLRKQHQVDAFLADWREGRWDEAVGKLNFEDQSVWRMTKKLLNKPTPSPPLQGKTHLACSTRDKAEVLAESLADQFTPNPPSGITPRVEAEVAAYIVEHPATDQLAAVVPITGDEIADIVEELKKGKAPGEDGITNEAIQKVRAKTAERITNIMNASLRLQHFPGPWKSAKVILFPKPGKPLRDPANYRPISLLPCLSKVLEKAIHKRLVHHADTTDLLIDQQFGFRPGHSTSHQLLRVANIISHGFNTKRHTGIVFLDVAKAFDRVWHEGLIHKLITANFPAYLINIVRSYLGSRSFHVALGGERSTTRPITAGVPQGGIISPFLFNVFTNDIPVDLERTELALYADDAAVIVRSLRIDAIGRLLQTSLDTISQWYADWRIALNSSKTTATLYTRKKNITPPIVTLQGQPITWTDSSTYLGVVLDQKLTYKLHVNRTRSRALGKLAALCPLLKHKNMSLDAKRRLYLAIIRPTMTYGSEVWCACRHSLLAKLQGIQNRSLRTVAGLPMFARTADVHRELSVKMLDEFLLNQHQKFYSGLEDHRNKLIKAQAAFVPSVHDRYPRPIACLQEGDSDTDS